MRSGHSRCSGGFSLIEALAAVVLLAIGITATISSLGAISGADTRAMETERMQNLAHGEFDQLVATDALTYGQTAGDCTDLGDPGYEWRAEKTSTDIDSIDSVQVDVAKKGTSFARPERVLGLICRPPATSTDSSSKGSKKP